MDRRVWGSLIRGLDAGGGDVVGPEVVDGLGGPATSDSAPLAIAGDGTHTLAYWSTDAAGNTEATNTLTFAIDTTPPVTTAMPSPAPVNGQVDGPGSVTLTATDAGSGVAATWCALDGGAAQAYSGPITISAGGLHTPSFWSTNLAGNTEAAHILTLQVDPQAATTPAGSVPSTLALTVAGVAPSFGAFTAGVAQTYTTTASLTITSTAQSPAPVASDPSATFPGRLVNAAAPGGPYELPQGLQVQATSAGSSSAGGGAYADLSVVNPATLLTHTAPVSDDQVKVGLRQPILATDALRTDTYTKTITFTLSTTSP